MADRVYLDYQSAKPVDPRVVEAMLPHLTADFGNPSSLHREGDRASAVLEAARGTIASFINADPGEIIFTSGATEANNLALLGYAARHGAREKHLVISEVEHISILNIARHLEKQGFTVDRVPVDRFGMVVPRKLRARLTEETILVSVGLASNEIGTLQPMEEIAAQLRGTGVALHTDAVAAQGLVPLDVRALPVDLMTLSSNDLYGPRGLGVLYVRRGVGLAPQILGGGQERGLRSGTENVAAVAGLARAVEIAREEMAAEAERLRGYRDRLIRGVLETIPGSHLNGHPNRRLPNNVHLRFDGIEGESMLLSLRDEGISVATGSACTSKTLEPSRTLLATGLVHEEAHGSLQFTFGRYSAPEDVDRVLAVLPGVVERLRSLSPLYRKE
jgi:cysteine desulfurase